MKQLARVFLALTILLTITGCPGTNNPIEQGSKISFDSNGGTGAMNDIYVKDGEGVTLPEVSFSGPNDKVFAGWAIEADGENYYANKFSLIMKDEDIVLYARWTTLAPEGWFDFEELDFGDPEGPLGMITGLSSNWDDTVTDFAIPSTINGVEVNIIDSDAFEGNSIITSITIPHTVSTISSEAFKSCSELKSITIQSENGLFLGYGALFSGNKLKTISLPRDTMVQTYLNSTYFSSYSDVERFIVDSSCTKLYSLDGVLYQKINGYYSLVQYPNGKTESLYRFPEKIYEIGKFAFQNNSAFTDISLPSTVTHIRSSAFYKCSELVSITIPENVVNIEGNAFSQCEKLETVIINAVEPPAIVLNLGSYSTSGIISTVGNYNPKIYVPAESLEAYKNAEVWSDYAEIIFSQADLGA